jgi:UTP--glucose-1-phosphate uridylyltransferase
VHVLGRIAMPLDLDPTTQALLDAHGFDRTSFERLRAAFRAGELSVDRNRVQGDLQPPRDQDVRPLPPLGSPERAELAERGSEALRAGQVGAIVLAGGMATRFGGVVKAGVEALPGHSFLSLKLADLRSVARAHGARVPAYVMSSFATHSVLREMILAEQTDAVPVELFSQFISLRLTPDGEPFIGADGKVSPYAPGHGDLPFALRASGALADFLAKGGRWLTVSNVDNLGATLDPAVIGAHIAASVEMTVEVGRRTPGELGGVPLVLDGKLQIIEDFRLPQGFDFSAVPHFNTNTFVLDAAPLDRDFPLTWFVVRKKVDGREAIQFEHLVGELSAFLRCGGLEIARDGLDGRFQPAKDPEELARRQPEIERILRARKVL